jgi:hypothetical protein
MRILASHIECLFGAGSLGTDKPIESTIRCGGNRTPRSYIQLYPHTLLTVGSAAISGLPRLANTVLIPSASNACMVVPSSAAMIRSARCTSVAKCPPTSTRPEHEATPPPRDVGLDSDGARLTGCSGAASLVKPLREWIGFRHVPGSCLRV